MNRPLTHQSEVFSKDIDNDVVYLSSPLEVSMDDDWYAYTNKDHFWMKWRFSFIKDYFESRKNRIKNILEIGCGNGVNMQLFQSELGVTIDGCDLNETALKLIENVAGKKYLFNIFDDNNQMRNKYNSVLLLDVIEHIEDDKEFVKASLSCLKKNGTVIINVPAFQSLYSKYDKNMGHIKRYNKELLETMLTDLGLQIDYMTYWGFFLLPVLLLRKMVMFFTTKKITSIGFEPPHEIINQAFLLLMKLERKLFPKPFFGTSLFAIAKKTDN